MTVLRSGRVKDLTVTPTARDIPNWLADTPNCSSFKTCHGSCLGQRDRRLSDAVRVDQGEVAPIQADDR
jgi:hypothetical protein